MNATLVHVHINGLKTARPASNVDSIFVQQYDSGKTNGTVGDDGTRLPEDVRSLKIFVHLMCLFAQNICSHIAKRYIRRKISRLKDMLAPVFFNENPLSEIILRNKINRREAVGDR